MSFIVIVTDKEDRERLEKVLDEKIINKNIILYMKEKNIDNIKNIKIDTFLINKEIEDFDKVNRIIENCNNVIINTDFNKNLERIYLDKNIKKIIRYGYNMNSDITISSIKDDESMISIQKHLTSVYGKNIDIQEIKAHINYGVNMYDILIIIALTIMYAR